MFVIVFYDIKEKRVQRVMKVCRRYLFHVQKSVFEGIINEAPLNKMKKELRGIINPKEDSVCIYHMDSMKFCHKEAIGMVTFPTDLVYTGNEKKEDHDKIIVLNDTPSKNTKKQPQRSKENRKPDVTYRPHRSEHCHTVKQQQTLRLHCSSHPSTVALQPALPAVIHYTLLPAVIFSVPLKHHIS